MAVRKKRADNHYFFYYTISKIFFQYFYKDLYKKKTSRSLSFLGVLYSESKEVVCSHDDVRGIKDVHTGEGNTFPSAGFSLGVRKDDHQCGNADEDTGVDGHCEAGGHGRDRAGHAENEEDVEEAGAYDVTHSNAGVALLCSDDRGNELGEGGAESNDGKTDERITHAECGGDLRGAVNDELSAADDGCSADHNENNTLGP